jgi:hypothetical protein
MDLASHNTNYRFQHSSVKALNKSSWLKTHGKKLAVDGEIIMEAGVIGCV